jgi:hypothetical protein
MTKDNLVVCSYSYDDIDKKDSIIIEKTIAPIYRTTVKKEFLDKLKPGWKFIWLPSEKEAVYKSFSVSIFNDQDFDGFLNTFNQKFNCIPINRPYKEVVSFLRSSK